jgi:hypothetical protein
MSFEIYKHLNNAPSEQEGLGLMYGKMGNSIYHFLLYRLTNEKEYEEKAKKLLDEVISGVPNLFNTNFDIGLSGIGYGIEFLIRNNYINGNSNTILKDFDDRIFRTYNENEINDLSLDSGLIGYLLYFLNRQENKSDELTFQVNLKILKSVIHKITAYMQMHIDDMTRDFDFDLMRPFPLILNCFANIMPLDIYRDKICNTLKSWIMYLTNFYPNLHSNRLTFALSLHHINEYLKNDEVDATIKNLLFSVDINKIEMFEIEPQTRNIRYSWIGLIIVLNNLIKKIDDKYPNYKQLINLRKKLKDRDKSLINDPLLIRIIEDNEDFSIETKNGLPEKGFIDLILPYKFG